MKKFVSIVIGLLFVSTAIWAQANAPWNTNHYKKLILTPNSVYKKDNIKKRKPVVLPPIRQADVAWSALVWEIVDVREKMNQYFYYPQTPTGERKNLMDVLLDGIKNQGLTAYDVDNDDFTTPISYEDIMKKLDAGEQTIQVRNQLTGELEDKKVESQGAGTADVLQFMLKQEWYFDKNTSTFQKRIIGICPIRVYEKETDFVQPLEDDDQSTTAYKDDTENQKLRQQLFWVYFPEARPLLAVNEALTGTNNSSTLSLDDVFIKHFFTGFITQVSGVRDQAIADYATGVNQIIEAERIRNEIMRLESGLWEY